MKNKSLILGCSLNEGLVLWPSASKYWNALGPLTFKYEMASGSRASSTVLVLCVLTLAGWPLQIVWEPACELYGLAECNFRSRKTFLQREKWKIKYIFFFIGNSVLVEGLVRVKPETNVKICLELWVFVKTVCPKLGLQHLWEPDLQLEQACHGIFTTVVECVQVFESQAD